MFQSTPPHGGRRPEPCHLHLSLRFQSTPPHGGRRSSGQGPGGEGDCFNPRPRMGGDLIHFIHCRITAQFQSTPPHGGRHPVIARLYGHLVSIHAPAWGATNVQIATRKQERFQSTPPHGGRHLGEQGRHHIFRFNPRPRMGGDPPPFLFDHIPQVSIHAPAWGATVARPTNGGGHPCFNPRPRMGGDDLTTIMHDQLAVSIHAPAWGATTSPRSDL